MEWLSSFYDFTKIDITLLWIIFLVCSAVYFVRSRKRTTIPGPSGIPILGYLPFLREDAHLTLMKLSKKYGGIFGLYLGRTYVVAVTDYKIAKELLAHPALQDRPPDAFQFLPDGLGFGSTNGLEWIEQSRYSLQEMKKLGLSGSTFEQHVQCEVMDFLNVLQQSNSEPIYLDKPLCGSILNIILSLVSGRLLPANDPGKQTLLEGLDSLAEIYASSSIINYFPTLFKIAVKLGFLKVGHKVKALENMNKFMKHIIEECKREGAHNYINSYVNEIKKRKNMDSKNWFTERNLIGNVQALTIGGSDTSKISLMWLLLTMAAFPNIQDKVQNELDTVLSEGQIVFWDDRRKLPYCHAAILEGQRWKTIAPLNVLRRANKDIDIQGYVIPKNSEVISVIYAFHNDTKYWKDPEKFLPERFLTDDGDGIRKTEAFEPFSMGKRRCPGETVAYIQIFIYFVSILQRFRILPAKEGEPVDLTEIFGLSILYKTQPLRFVPRSK